MADNSQRFHEKVGTSMFKWVAGVASLLITFGGIVSYVVSVDNLAKNASMVNSVQETKIDLLGTRTIDMMIQMSSIKSDLEYIKKSPELLAFVDPEFEINP
jgi:hypothetical protein